MKPTPTEPWHALFAPLPAEVVPRRQPVASPEILAKPEGAAIAGWEQVTIELSAPSGLRIVLVVLDGSGQPISASDTVLYQSAVVQDSEAGARSAVEYYQESVGGRLEPDGTFRGTRWHTLTVEAGSGEESPPESTPSEPSAADIAAIKALVAEVLRRC